MISSIFLHLLLFLFLWFLPVPDIIISVVPLTIPTSASTSTPCPVSSVSLSISVSFPLPTPASILISVSLPIPVSTTPTVSVVVSIQPDKIRQLASKLPDHAISFTNPEQAKSLAVEAATVASQWLDFLHQDPRERLSAVQESRNRVDDTLKAECHFLFQQKNLLLPTRKVHLESSLDQVKDMQSRCNEGLRQMKEASSGKDGTNQETNLAVQAAAASIFSTCRYLLSKMKPPPNSP
ncbi:hypothetical protein Bca52824_029160 [Brassica carinata]|uniref:Uncharacterized protein n=1 Tax=Brassica carinata TaxID=52824 RepID=A0A8X8AR83_BRACI|nr:hypothetical protein Bca52824_029160 [Brassica carinata]